MPENTETSSSNVIRPEKFNAGEADELRARVQTELATQKLSYANAAKEIGVSKSSLTHWLNETSETSVETVEKIRAWLDPESFESSAPISGSIQVPQYTQTPTSKRILDLLVYCHAYNDLGCVYGGAGVGKTSTIKHYQSEHSNVFVMVGSPEVSGVHPMLEELARAVGLEDCVGGSRTISRTIRNRLKSLKSPFLIVDEAQELGLNALNTLRSIHDEVEVGVALLGNPVIYERMSGGSRSAHYAQLFSRVGAQIYAMKPVCQDVLQLLEKWGLKDKASIEYLMRIAARPGALRSVTKVLRLAIAAAEDDVNKVTLKQIRFAAKNLGSEIAP
jgi:DNA transposition AAA+ family ATPase